MCGICGVIQLEGEPRKPLSIERLDWMTDVMTHRGPNDRGTYLESGIALGVRRLSIVDVEGGHQPFGNEDGSIWAIQNGELYNHPEHRRTLAARGHRFASRCDTEVIPHLYEQHGPRFAEQLRGKFGLAVWDGARRRAVLARDRLGVKPLYYGRAGNMLVFGSELKAVLASGLFPLELDYDAIDAYLTFGFVPGPRTPYHGISKLLPGHILVAERGDFHTEPYWSFPRPAEDPPGLSAEEFAEGLLERLEESVKLRLMSDVPLGAMLSGGLDSSLIVALMARNMSDPVKTFSIGFVEDGDFNELEDARRVAEFYGTEHHPLELSFSDRHIDLRELAWHLDEPIYDLSALGFLALSELASKYVTVALSGQGADELLGGYRKHQAAKVVGALSGAPQFLRTAVGSIASHRSPDVRRAGRALAAREPAERLLAMSGFVDDDLRQELVHGPLAETDGLEALRAVQLRARGVPDDPLPVTLHIDSQLALVDNMLHYFDRTSMAHSLEVRVPFLDHEVVEYCAQIPSALKVRRLTTKYVLRRAARGLVPDDIIDKRKLGFFRGASSGWLKAQMEASVREYLLAPDARTKEFLDRRVVERMLHDHASGRDTSKVYLLLALLLLEVWLTTYAERALPTSPSNAEVAA